MTVPGFVLEGTERGFPTKPWGMVYEGIPNLLRTSKLREPLRACFFQAKPSKRFFWFPVTPQRTGKLKKEHTLSQWLQEGAIANHVRGPKYLRHLMYSAQQEIRGLSQYSVTGTGNNKKGGCTHANWHDALPIC